MWVRASGSPRPSRPRRSPGCSASAVRLRPFPSSTGTERKLNGRQILPGGGTVVKELQHSAQNYASQSICAIKDQTASSSMDADTYSVNRALGPGRPPWGRWEVHDRAGLLVGIVAEE